MKNTNRKIIIILKIITKIKYFKTYITNSFKLEYKVILKIFSISLIIINTQIFIKLTQVII